MQHMDMEQIFKLAISTEWNPTLRCLCFKAFKRIGDTLTAAGMAGLANDIVLQVIWNISNDSGKFATATWILREFWN